jgi:phage FluMu protein Com
MNCPHCKKLILDIELAHYLAVKGGSARSERKAQASRENGKKHKAQVLDYKEELPTITIDNQ